MDFFLTAVVCTVQVDIDDAIDKREPDSKEFPEFHDVVDMDMVTGLAGLNALEQETHVSKGELMLVSFLFFTLIAIFCYSPPLFGSKQPLEKKESRHIM